MPTWPIDEAYPKSTTKIKDFPSGWQDILDYIEDAIERQHGALDSSNAGKHIDVEIADDPAYLDLSDSDETAPAGRFRCGVDGTVIKFQGRNVANNGWTDLLVFPDAATGVAQFENSVLDCGWESFPEDTVCVFKQANVPTGWTKVTSVNDRMLRVVSANGGAVGGDGWDIASNFESSLSGSPDHVHQLDNGAGSSVTTSGPSVTVQPYLPPQTNPLASHAHTHTISPFDSDSEGDQHSHTFTWDSSWRPTYKDIILASRNPAPTIS